MSFSYSGDPRKSDKDKVRFLIGDTDANYPLLQDAEVLYLIETQGTALAASVAAALAIAAKYSRMSDESVGDVSKSYSQRAEAYRKLSVDLRRRNAEKAVCPYAGGISEVDKDTTQQDPDVVPSVFTKNLHNNPRANVQSPTDDDYT